MLKSTIVVVLACCFLWGCQPSQAIKREKPDEKQVAFDDSLRLVQTCEKVLDGVKFNRLPEIAMYREPLSLTYFLSLDADSIRTYRLLHVRFSPARSKAAIDVQINEMNIPVTMRFCRRDSIWIFNNLWREGREWSWQWSRYNQEFGNHAGYSSAYIETHAVQLEQELWNYYCEPKAE